eukprot:jgi/Orpsp1_1/1183280/evm.model.c7180000084543.1
MKFLFLLLISIYLSFIFSLPANVTEKSKNCEDEVKCHNFFVTMCDALKNKYDSGDPFKPYIVTTVYNTTEFNKLKKNCCGKNIKSEIKEVCDVEISRYQDPLIIYFKANNMQKYIDNCNNIENNYIDDECFSKSQNNSETTSIVKNETT